MTEARRCVHRGRKVGELKAYGEKYQECVVEMKGVWIDLEALVQLCQSQAVLQISCETYLGKDNHKASL